MCYSFLKKKKNRSVLLIYIYIYIFFFCKNERERKSDIKWREIRWNSVRGLEACTTTVKVKKVMFIIIIIFFFLKFLDSIVQLFRIECEVRIGEVTDNNRLQTVVGWGVSGTTPHHSGRKRQHAGDRKRGQQVTSLISLHFQSLWFL